MTSSIPDKPESDAPQTTAKPAAEMTTILTPNPASQQLLESMKQQIGLAWQRVWGNQPFPATPVLITTILTVPLLLVLSSVLSFLNALPLIPDLLELIGLIYLLWFAYRYLLFAESRQELVQIINGIKSKVLG
jgi:hypothetical protein